MSASGSHENPVLIVAGPTASGKSALAARIADDRPSVLINADSMQLYKDLSVLTARPDTAAMHMHSHRLYGVLDGDAPNSAGTWRDAAVTEIEAAHTDGVLPILVGGTGMYLWALMHGLSPIPDIPAPVRAAARARLEEIGNDTFHAALAERDRESAARIAPGDSQRLVRAWEVLEATGRTLPDWQMEPGKKPSGGWRFVTVAVLPPREALYAATDARFVAMIDVGAVDEVRALRALGLDPALPVMKALGVREIGRHLDGEINLEEAIQLSQQSTRRYAKRQLTWVRNQIIPDFIVNEQYSERAEQIIFPEISSFLLTQEI